MSDFWGNFIQRDRSMMTAVNQTRIIEPIPAHLQMIMQGNASGVPHVVKGEHNAFS